MSLENFGVVATNIDRRKSEEERLSLKMIGDTIQNARERYEVALPFQNDVEPFPESRSTALHRLKCIERKLEKIGLVHKYDEKIAEYVDKGYAEKNEDLGDLCNRPKLWYIPHFPIENVNKPGKMRLVFDVY
jgi:hypothetical protein